MSSITPSPFIQPPVMNAPKQESSVSQPPTENTGRAPGDNRTVEEITNGPLFKQIFGSSDPKNPQAPLLAHDRLEDFYWQIGGNFNDPTLSYKERADVAANAEKVLQFIAQSGGNDSIANNGFIEGETKFRSKIAYQGLSDGALTVEGSEARMVLNFARDGYHALQGPGGQNIEPTHRPVIQVEEPPVENWEVPFPTPDDKIPAEDERTALQLQNEYRVVDFVPLPSELPPKQAERAKKLVEDLTHIVGDFRKTNPDEQDRRTAMNKLGRVTQFLASKINDDRSNARDVHRTFAEFSQIGYPALEKYRAPARNEPAGTSHNPGAPVSPDPAKSMMGRGLGRTL